MMFKELTQEEAMEMSRQDGYDLGVEQGRTEGIAEGEASGRAAEKIEMARIMKDKDYSIAEISELTGLSVEEIEKL